jgi:ribose transport system substrate-binding protein
MRTWTIPKTGLPAALCIAAFAAAGCGSSGSSTSSSSTSSSSSSNAPASSSKADQAGAQAAVDAHRGVPKFIAPGPKFDASPAKGKRIALVPDYPTLPFVQEINAGLKAAAKASGLTIDDCSNDGTVGGWVKCFDRAIASKPAAIVLDGSPSPSQLQPQINAAKRAGIPVIANHVPLDAEFPPGTLPATNTTGLTAIQPGPFPLGAKLMADYAVAQDGDKVNALIITANEAPASRGMVKMIQNELKAKCPSCQNTVINVPIVDWATKLQDATRTALLRDPKINWAMPIYDGAMAQVVPGVQAAQRKGKVKVTGFNGQGFALTGIANGTVASTMGENLEWTGWSTIDRVLRVVVNPKAPQGKVIADTPVRVWDSKDISEAGSPPVPTKGYGVSYQSDYQKLWGLK